MYHTVLMYYIPRMMGKAVPRYCEDSEVEEGKKIDLNSKRFELKLIVAQLMTMVVSVLIINLTICICCVRRSLECLLKIKRRDS